MSDYETLIDFTYYECPDCEYNLILLRTDVQKVVLCPLCASDNGHSVIMDHRAATLTDKVEGRDDRKAHGELRTMNKIPREEYDAWKDSVVLGTQRFGQAFLNHFGQRLKDAMPDPGVYYSHDAEALILQKYVETN